MLTVLLISLAAICKSIADTLDDHFDTSVFKKLPWQVWDANRSQVKAFRLKVFGIKITNYKFDPWHIANSLMIVCWCFVAVFNDLELPGIWQVVVIGVVFNLVFELFYTKILRSR
jgi:hypothetical protein